MARINRTGLKTLVQRGYTHSELAQAFALSRTWTIEIVAKGKEPRHPGIVLYVNDKIKALLAASA